MISRLVTGLSSRRRRRALAGICLVLGVILLAWVPLLLDNRDVFGSDWLWVLGTALSLLLTFLHLRS